MVDHKYASRRDEIALISIFIEKFRLYRDQSQVAANKSVFNCNNKREITPAKKLNTKFLAKYSSANV